MNARDRLIISAIWVLFTAIGLALLFFSGRDLVLGWRSQHWPSVRGRVVASGVTRDVRRYRDRWKVQVLYSYSVGGASFSNDRIRFDGRADWFYGTSLSNNQQTWVNAIAFLYEKNAQAFLARHRKGRVVQVFYDPADPQTATLIPGWDSGNVYGVCISLLTAGIFSILSWRFLRREDPLPRLTGRKPRPFAD